ncbi:MAG TPA: fumarylacetoacetate hydrolase family protein [Anaerovoracaceae bacterium]|nr:fumarylacetoacetate hydrolase family protein [Anaerovoracaceae bacterium]
MIYATINYDNKEQLCCVDNAGSRIFLLEHFLKQEFREEDLPKSMLQFISCYLPEWTDKIALFFGLRPEYAIPLSDVDLLAPIPKPARNIICLGKNYQAHAEELKGQIFSDSIPRKPIYFTKPDHTVIGPNQTILLHGKITSKVDYEVELAVIIGKNGIDIPIEKAEEHIFGYTIANDVSARDLQHDHTQWYKGKSLTTHCPMGPWIVHKSELPFPLSLDLRCTISGELRQHGNTRDLIFDIPTIISDLSLGYELRPGDIILTGTPAGVGMGFDPPKYLKAKDTVLCEIDKIGSLSNSVNEG